MHFFSLACAKFHICFAKRRLQEGLYPLEVERELLYISRAAGWDQSPLRHDGSLETWKSLLTVFLCLYLSESICKFNRGGREQKIKKKQKQIKKQGCQSFGKVARKPAVAAQRFRLYAWRKRSGVQSGKTRHLDLSLFVTAASFLHLLFSPVRLNWIGEMTIHILALMRLSDTRKCNNIRPAAPSVATKPIHFTTLT